MSHKFLFAAAASAMLLTAPALAAATTQHAVHAQAKTAAKTQAASTKTASSKAVPAKTTRHHHRSKIARNMSVRGDREVRALNALESAGYRKFNNLHASGTNFVATAMKAGKSYDVTVTPAGSIEANKA